MREMWGGREGAQKLRRKREILPREGEN